MQLPGVSRDGGRSQSFGSNLQGSAPYNSPNHGEEGPQVGSTVLVFNTGTEIDSREGQCIQWIPASGSWRVHLDNGQEKDIKAENLAVIGSPLSPPSRDFSKGGSPPGTGHSGYPEAASLPLPIGSLPSPGAPNSMPPPPGSLHGTGSMSFPQRAETRDNMVDPVAGLMDTQTTFPAGYSQPPTTQMLGTPHNMTGRLPGVSETAPYDSPAGALPLRPPTGSFQSPASASSLPGGGPGSAQLPSALAALSRESRQASGGHGSMPINSMPPPGTEPQLHQGYSRPGSHQGYARPGSGSSLGAGYGRPDTIGSQAGYGRPDTAGSQPGYGRPGSHFGVPGTRDSQSTVLGIQHSYPDSQYLAPGSGGSSGTVHGIHAGQGYSPPASHEKEFHIGSMSIRHGFAPGQGHELAPPAPLVGKLRVRIIAGYNLRNTDLGVVPGEVSDPFVVLRFGQTEYKTSAIQNNLNPVWNSQAFEFPVFDEDGTLLMEVFNANQFYAHDSLGRLEVSISRIIPGEKFNRTEPLRDGGNGRLEYEVLYVPPEKVAEIGGSNFSGYVRPSSGKLRPNPFAQVAAPHPKVQHKIPLPDFHGMGAEAFSRPPPKVDTAPVGEMRRQLEYQSAACHLGQYEYDGVPTYFPKQAEVDKRAWHDDPFYGWRNQENNLQAGSRRAAAINGPSKNSGAKELEKWSKDPFDGWLKFDEQNHLEGPSAMIQEARESRKLMRLPSFEDENIPRRRFDGNHSEYVEVFKLGHKGHGHAHRGSKANDPHSNWKDDAFYGWLPNRGPDAEMMHELHRPLEEARRARLPSFSENMALPGKGFGVLKIWIQSAYRLSYGRDDQFRKERPSACVHLQLGQKEKWTQTVESKSSDNDQDKWCMDWDTGAFQFEVDSESNILVLEVIDYLGHHKVDKSVLGQYKLTVRELMEDFERKKREAQRMGQQDPTIEPMQFEKFLEGAANREARVKFKALLTRYQDELSRHAQQRALPNDGRDQPGLWNRPQSTQSSHWNQPHSNQSAGQMSAPREAGELGELQVRVIRAFNLKNMDSGYFGDVSDPYVTLKLLSQDDSKRKRTKTINNNLNPVWDSPDFMFKVYDHSDSLLLEVYDADIMKGDDFIGRLTIPLTKFIEYDNQRLKIRERLQDIEQGELEVEIGFYWMKP